MTEIVPVFAAPIAVVVISPSVFVKPLVLTEASIEPELKATFAAA